MLCNCTFGHEKAMWSSIFGKQVDAEIIDCFQRGGNDCVVKIIHVLCHIVSVYFQEACQAAWHL